MLVAYMGTCGGQAVGLVECVPVELVDIAEYLLGVPEGRVKLI